ncbi:ribokinase [Teichococcus vastitatis]|uniref:Deoxyribokinase n=1 Tax=Teichococcus vastitatis TaxID=2307076 RepID=A0ABS9WCC8_9PROT|nr:ribokinase [Pseudoroseomonas vastitatis]MCI0756944.1 ribokinase [Pseudoroseomonas vastitatis]
MSTRIGVVGSNMVDLVSYIDRMPEAGETLAAPSFAMGHGGKGANQAVAAARLGAEVLMVSRVGEDLFGEGTIRNLRELGIDTRHVWAVPGQQSGVAPIFVERSGENRILIIKGANEHLLPADVGAAAADLRQCGLILLQLEVPLDTIYHTIAWAAREGIEVLLNPAPAVPELDVSRILAASFLVPNQTELAILTNMPTDTPAQAEAAARSLVARGLRTVIVTLGADGALLVTDGPAVHIPPVRVQPHDTTGAGDAFIGAFAQHYVRSRDVAAAMRWGAAYAADSITRPGTQKAFADLATFQRFRAACGLT